MSEELFYDLIYNIVIISLLILPLILFVHRKIKKKVNIPVHLAIGLLFAVIGQLFYFLPIISTFQGISTEIRYDFISNIFLILLFFCAYLHYRALSSRKKISLLDYSIFTLTVVVLTLLFFASVNFLTSDMSLDNLINFLGSILGVLMFIPPLTISFKINRLIREKATKIEWTSIFFIQLSNIIYLLDFILLIFNFNTVELVGFSVGEFANILILIGLFILVINYILHPNYIYRLSFPVHEVIIFNYASIPVYIRHISTRNIPALDEDTEILMGGALTAITEMIKETLGTKTILNYIDAGNYEIFFSEIPHNEGIIVIISSGSTRYLQKSLKQFSKVIAENFLTEIKLDGGIEEDTKKEIDSLLLKTFPYFDLTQEE